MLKAAALNELALGRSLTFILLSVSLPTLPPSLLPPSFSLLLPSFLSPSFLPSFSSLSTTSHATVLIDHFRSMYNLSHPTNTFGHPASLPCGRQLPPLGFTPSGSPLSWSVSRTQGLPANT